MKDTLKLTLDITTWEWACLCEAVRNYVDDNPEIDLSELDKYADYIESRLGLDTP